MGPEADYAYALQFNAPLYTAPPVTADLKDKAAQASAQVKTIRAAADALVRGDLEALRALTTQPAHQQMQEALQQGGPAAKKMLAQYGAEMKKRAGAIKRVVVRDDRAIAIVGSRKGVTEWSSLVREGDAWNLDE